jgi:hypothetical protein
MKVNWFFKRCGRAQASLALMAAGVCPPAAQRRAETHR